MSVALADVLVRAGLGFVWDSVRLDKGLISRMLLGGFKVDFESGWVGLELICAMRAARCCAVVFGLLRGVVRQVLG